MVLVSNFVLPGPKPTARENVLAVEVRLDFCQCTIPLKSRSRISMIETSDVSAHNLVLGFQKVCVNETLDGFLEQSLLVDRLVGGLGNFEHDGPVGAGRRLG